LQTPIRIGRRSVRLKTHTYSDPGFYFVTICSYQKRCTFGQIENSNCHPTFIGKIIQSEWMAIPDSSESVTLDDWVLMPNHLHGILQLSKTNSRQNSLGQIMGKFKVRVTSRVRHELENPCLTLWQRSYWDRVIRNENELTQVRQYIQNNPLKWELDQLNPCNW
jgi:putative transposase